MLKPSHREKSFTANRVFTDREGDREVFGAACDRTETREVYQVLMWYGVGGQGKSALLREFGRMLASRNEAAAEARSDRRLALAKVDFDDERLKRIDSALYSLRLQLGQSTGFAFHTFDAAFVSYYKKTRPGIDVAAEFPELFKGEKEGLSDLLDVLDDHLSLVTDLASVALPGANLIYKWGMRLSGRLKTWWSTRGNQVLAGIEKLTPEEILQKLPSYLGIDLCDGIAAKPSIRPVILLDTYEALWRERGQKDALTDRRTDAWVRLLVQDAPGTLFVIVGRDKLRWGEIDPAWNEVIDARLLGGLSAEDADRFLAAAPITEDDIRARIVGSSEGLPFYLDLQVSQYEAIRERGEAPVVAQFGGTPSDILSRFLEHLNDTDQSVLRLASYFNTITRPAMTELADAFPQRAVNFSFDRMIARSAFTPVADDAYTIHALMQEELQRREREENEALFRKIHRHLFEYYRGRLTGRQVDDIKEVVTQIKFGLSHALFVSTTDYVSWLLQVRHLLRIHGDWEYLQIAYRRAIEALQESGNSQSEQLIALRNNFALSLQSQGRHEEARVVFEKVAEEADGFTFSHDSTKSVLGYNVGLNLIELGKNDEALEFLQRASAGPEQADPVLTSIRFESILDMANLSERFSSSAAAETMLREACLGLLGKPTARLYSSAVALDCLSKNFARQERHVEAVYFRMTAENDLAKMLNWSHNDGVREELSRFFSDGTSFDFDFGPIARVSSSLMEKVMMDYRPIIFDLATRTLLVDFRGVGYLHPVVEPDRLLSEVGDYCAPTAELHPESDNIITRLKADLDMFDYKIAYRKLHNFPEVTGVRTLIFVSEKFDCRYDRASKNFYILSPPFKDYSLAFGALYFCETFRAAATFGGIVPPPETAGLVPLARYAHGLGLDALTKLAEGVQELDEWQKEKFLNLLSEDGRKFITMQWAGASRDELYCQYCIMYDTVELKRRRAQQ